MNRSAPKFGSAGKESANEDRGNASDGWTLDQDLSNKPTPIRRDRSDFNHDGVRSPRFAERQLAGSLQVIGIYGLVQPSLPVQTGS